MTARQQWIDTWLRSGLGPLVVIVTLGFVLRAASIGTYWVNPDEGIYYSTLTSASASTFWTEVGENAHPPLYYLVLRGLAWITDDFMAYRWVSCLLGCVVIAASFFAVREVSNRRASGTVAGIVAALAIALSPAMVELSGLIRPYMLQLAALTSAMFFVARFIRLGDRRSAVGYVVTLCVAILTHYSSLLAFGAIVAALGAMLVLRRLPRERRATLAIAHAVPVLLMAGLYWFHLRPNLIGSALQTDSFETWLKPFTIQAPADAWLQIYSYFYFLFREFAGVGVLLLAGGIALAIVERRPLIFGPPLVALLLAIVAAWAKKYPFGSSRHSIYLATFLLPPAAWLVGRGLTAKPRLALATGAGLLGLTLLRNQVADLTGKAHAPIQLIAERILTMADRGDMEPALRRIRESGEVVVMSKECYYLLMPLYHRERETAVWNEDRAFFRFKWDRARVFVADAWQLRVDVRGIGEKTHLLRFVDAIDRAAPEIALSTRSKVWMLFGGWSLNAPMLLRANDEGVPESSKLITYGKGVPGLFAFLFRMDRYVRGMRRR